MSLIALLVIVLVGCAILYFFPAASKIVYFVWAVAALIWLATVCGLLPSQVALR